MVQVRATNLQDLIYKKGQAGITKASVTLIFNNANKATSPPAFVDSPTISVARQNKYLINGKNATLQEVSSMFQSVQLNIHNPNFLIMQGKITHVLNMKANQILGMVEEAAGTRLYEDRKEKAIKMMEKKDLKLAQSTMDKVAKSLERMNNASARMEHLEKMKTMAEEDIADIQASIVQVHDDRSKNGGSFFELEEKVKAIGKEVAKFKTQCSLKTASIKEEMAAIAGLEANLSEANLSRDAAQANYTAVEQENKQVMKDYEAKRAALKDTESLVETLTTGLGSSEGQENGYMDQLSATKQEVSQTSSEIQQLKYKLSHLVKELKVEEPKAKKARVENAALVAELDSKKNVLAMIT
ncbi:Structural maintenance of chromosomes protein 2, partial [Kappamyces sp. JEL0680]